MRNRILTFGKAQLSALLGGVTDYLVMLTATEFFHLHYTRSIVVGGVAGAYVNFKLNKAWTFRSDDAPYRHSANRQLLKFAMVVANSILMKSAGTFLITTWLKMDYKISRIFTDLIVSLVINYNLQKWWVFRKVRS